MAKRQKELTEAQIAFRASILKSKRNKPPTAPKPEPVESEDRIASTLVYVKNCMYWIHEYETGRTDRSQMLRAAFAMRRHMSDIIYILSQPDSELNKPVQL
jgi:hypothetical protein